MKGQSFGFGDQVADPKPPRVAAVKSRGDERRGNVGTMIPAGMVERGERKRTVDEVSKGEAAFLGFVGSAPRHIWFAPCIDNADRRELLWDSSHLNQMLSF